ncbi:MAG: tetratricopeptide repeat protein [Caulobacterales bacterium]
MQYQDILGNPITANDRSVAADVGDFVDGFLSYETKAANVLRAAETDPDCSLANTYAAMLWLFLESPEAPQKAAPFLARAKTGAATKREQLNLAFAQAWANDDPAEALAIGEALNTAYPRDLTILKVRQYLLFNQGDAPTMLRVAQDVFDANRDVAQMHGMIAFALEQCHLLPDAEQAAHTALAMKQKEPWAQHALAHVMLTQGRVDEGARFLEHAAPGWRDLNSFMFTHNWWHLALFAISQGQADKALQIYDRAVWSMDKSYSQDQAGALSLLVRLNLAGVPVGDRWADLAVHIEARGSDATLPFLSLHYLYALARANSQHTVDMFTAIERRASFGTSVWSRVALPAARGLLAHAYADYPKAAENLAIALPQMSMIGGSHAQRDLFEQIWLDALVRSGQWSAAQEALELRRRHDPDGAPLNTLLAEVYGKLGLKPQAAKAASRAAATRAKHATP